MAHWKAFCILILAGLLFTLGAQPQTPSFEVASVKISDNNDFLKGFRRSGGRITWTTNRLVLVAYAYHVPYYRISGIDPDPTYYAVQAETDPAATDGQVRLMMQKLLVERFQLAVHRETRDRPVFSLLVAKGGPKFRAVKPEDEVSPPPAFLKGRKLPEGTIMNLMEGHPVLTGRRVTMQQLAEAIVGEVRTSVLDKTGLPGTFDIDLNYVSDNTPTKDDDVPSIFIALQEQLGLRLEKQIAPVEILVVDHMEKKPAAN